MAAIIRRVAALFLLLLTTGCGEEQPAPPTAPTPPNIPRAPSAPSTPAPTFTLSGVVTERFSGRPVQGAKVWVEPFPKSQVRSWPPAGMRETPSDEAGRYSISGLPSIGTVWVSTANTWRDPTPYVHQCVTTVTVEGDTTFDVTITSTADLVALNTSTGPTPANSRIVSGTVFETTANGRQPVSNAWVGYAATGSDAPFAETITDAAGHYRLCGLPKEPITLAAVPAFLNIFYAPVDSGPDAIRDIEVKRK